MFTVGIVYLSIPVFLVLFTFFSTPFVLLSAVSLVALLFCLYKYRHEESSVDLQTLSRYWPLLLVCFIIAYLSLVYPFKSWDWEKHFAVLNTLIKETWPPVINLNNQDWFLRYYIAWYAVPALFTKIFGAQSLTFALVIWTVTGLFIALALAFHNMKKTWHLLMGALVFFFFSGLDIVSALLQNKVGPITSHWLQWIYPWLHIGSNLFNIAWIPQHITGISVATCLFLYNRRLALQYSGVIVTMTALWSPFCAFGLIPIVAWAAYKEGYKHALSIQNLFVSPLIAITIVLYLIQDAGQVPFTLAWQHTDFSFFSLIKFFAIEFLLILVFLYFLERDKKLLIALGTFLLLLGLFRGGVHNDLLMRGAMSSICVIAVLLAKHLIDSLKSEGRCRKILATYFILGAFPVLLAFAKGLSMERVDKTMNFEKLSHLHPYEKRPYMTTQYLVKTQNMITVSGIPLLRDVCNTEEFISSCRMRRKDEATCEKDYKVSRREERRKQAEKDRKARRISQLIACGREKCNLAIRSSARHPSTVDIHHFMGYSSTAHANGRVTIRQDFSAKNSFGVELTYTARCLVGDDLFEFNIFERGY